MAKIGGDFVDIGITALHDREEAARKLQEYLARFVPTSNTQRPKMVSDGVALLVGCAIEGKIAQGARVVCAKGLQRLPAVAERVKSGLLLCTKVAEEMIEIQK